MQNISWSNVFGKFFSHSADDYILQIRNAYFKNSWCKRKMRIKLQKGFHPIVILRWGSQVQKKEFAELILSVAIEAR